MTTQKTEEPRMNTNGHDRIKKAALKETYHAVFKKQCQLDTTNPAERAEFLRLSAENQERFKEIMGRG
jgi:hypothetical protein